MTRSIIHKFRISGMHDSNAVTVVRNSLAAIPGVRAVNVDMRKMQAEVIASRPIEVEVLRKALGHTDFMLTDLTTSNVLDPRETRNDEVEEQ
jgi:cation transport ATPase